MLINTGLSVIYVLPLNNYSLLYCTAGNVTMLRRIQLNVDSDLSEENPQFNLTCVSTGGPATTVTWTRDSMPLDGGLTVLDNAMTAQYTHTLTVTGTLPGHYECTVSNNKPSTVTRSFTMQGNLRIQYESKYVSTRPGAIF